MYLQPRKAIYILFNTIVCTWPHLKLDYEKSFDTIGHLFFSSSQLDIILHLTLDRLLPCIILEISFTKKPQITSHLLANQKRIFFLLSPKYNLS